MTMKEKLQDPAFRAWFGFPDEGYEANLSAARLLEEAAYELEAVKAEEPARAEWTAADFEAAEEAAARL